MCCFGAPYNGPFSVLVMIDAAFCGLNGKLRSKRIIIIFCVCWQIVYFLFRSRPYMCVCVCVVRCVCMCVLLFYPTLCPALSYLVLFEYG